MHTTTRGSNSKTLQPLNREAPFAKPLNSSTEVSNNTQYVHKKNKLKRRGRIWELKRSGTLEFRESLRREPANSIYEAISIQLSAVKGSLRLLMFGCSTHKNTLNSPCTPCTHTPKLQGSSYMPCHAANSANHNRTQQSVMKLSLLDQ